MSRFQGMTLAGAVKELERARAELARLDYERELLVKIIEGFRRYLTVILKRQEYEIVPFGWWEATAQKVMDDAAYIRSLST